MRSVRIYDEKYKTYMFRTGQIDSTRLGIVRSKGLTVSHMTGLFACENWGRVISGSLKHTGRPDRCDGDGQDSISFVKKLPYLAS